MRISDWSSDVCSSDLRLAGTTVTTPVVRNHPIALTKKEHHLIVPIIGAERPAMMEHDCLRIFGAPILVEDPSPVLRGDEGHVKVIPDQVAGQQDRRRCLVIGWRARTGQLSGALTPAWVAEIGRDHVRTPANTAQLVCGLQLE